MNCIEWEESIAQYVGRDLDSAAVAAVERHLETCCACTALAGALARDREWLRDHPPELEAAGYDAMRVALRREIVRRRRAKRLAAVLVVAASIAAAVITVTTRVASPIVTPGSGSQRAQLSAPRSQTADIAGPPPTISRVRSAHHKDSPLDVQAIEAAWEELNGAGAPIAKGSTSPIEMRIATSDPNIVIIWLQPTQEGSDD